jgi:hypothetical protein
MLPIAFSLSLSLSPSLPPPSLSDLSWEAINLVNVSYKTEVSDVFRFETFHEADSDGDDVFLSEVPPPSSL